jgi:hypothetical protein
MPTHCPGQDGLNYDDRSEAPQKHEIPRAVELAVTVQGKFYTGSSSIARPSRSCEISL